MARQAKENAQAEERAKKAREAAEREAEERARQAKEKAQAEERATKAREAAELAEQAEREAEERARQAKEKAQAEERATKARREAVERAEQAKREAGENQAQSASSRARCAAASAQICVGSMVEMRGLVRSAQHNGKTGTVERYDENRGRWAVRLHGVILGVKTENLCVTKAEETFQLAKDTEDPDE